MKKLLTITILLIGLVASYFLYSRYKYNKKDTEVLSEKDDQSSFQSVNRPILTNPKQLIVYRGDDITIYADVEEVGVSRDTGQLQTPSSWETVGWYVGSSQTGEIGNIVIDGHYDTNTGNPAVFFPLKNIKVNDKVILKDRLGRSFTYKITDIFYINIYDPDRLRVFNDSSNPTLTLITCGGVWDPRSGTYNKRLVARADFVTSDLVVY